MLETIVASVLNKFVSSYCEIDPKSLTWETWSDAKFTNLRLKREALDKFHLPVNVIEGYVGTLRMSIPWSNIKNQPVKLSVDDVYILATPAADSHYDPDEDTRRAQAAKMERLATSELMTARPTPGVSAEDEAKNSSFMASVTARVVDNIQITINNIHIRYEDKLSVPGHPFAVGLTLSGFSVESTNAEWEPTYLVNSGEGVHKLAKLESLAMYFDTDAPSLAGMEADDALAKFTELIANDTNKPDHQFILKPVSGQGRLILNKHFSATTPKVDAELLFNELGFVLDSDQYRDTLSMADLFHFYTRQHQYRRFRLPDAAYAENRPRALFQFAIAAIRSEVHQKHKVWTWDHFRERRDDRLRYIELFKTSQTSHPPPEETQELAALEDKLSLRDLKLYRSMARSDMRKAKIEAARITKEQDDARGGQPVNRGWLGWIWGSNPNPNHQSEQPQDILSNEEREELYEAIDWNEQASQEAANAVDATGEGIRLRVAAKLDTGSFVLRQDPHGRKQDMVSVLFDAFSANVLQRSANLEAEIALAGMRVYDGTKENTTHPQIVAVKEEKSGDLNLFSPSLEGPSDGTAPAPQPFFYAKFENNPLDKRADTALTVKLRYMEIFYHAGYIEAIVAFFKPPASQLESVAALVDVASETLEGLRKETRAGLEYALQNHKTVDLRVDMNAPIIIIPEDITVDDCVYMVVDAGRIIVTSDLVNQEALQIVKDKEKTKYAEEDWERLEGLMYDKFHIDLKDTQVLLGTDLKSCMAHLSAKGDDAHLHLLRRVNITWRADRCILPQIPNLAAFKVSGHLPELAIDFSDVKYRNLMKIVDSAIPRFESYDEEQHSSADPAHTAPPNRPSKDRRKSGAYSQALMYSEDDDDPILPDDEADGQSNSDDGDDGEFYEAPDLPDSQSANAHQKKFVFEFSVDRLSAAISKSQSNGHPDMLLAVAVLSGSRLAFFSRNFDMNVDIAVRSLTVEDKMVDATQANFQELVSSDVALSTHASEQQDLVTIKYTQCNPEGPEFMTVHEGFNKSVEVNMNALSVIITRGSILVLFDFILATFTNPESSSGDQEPQDAGTVATQAKEEEEQLTLLPQPAIEKMRVRVKLNSIVLIFNNDGERLATLELSAADVAILLRGPTLRVTGRLGNLFIADDLKTHSSEDDDFRKLLQIKGDQVADFTYETFSKDSTNGQTYPGFDAQVFLRTGSLQFTLLDEPVHRILRFLTQFARMKAVWDAARMAASNQVAVPTKMSYDVIVNTPIILFPRNNNSTDIISAHLGEITAKNSFENDQVQEIRAGLRSIRLTSHIQDKSISMLEDANLEVQVVMTEGIDRSTDQLNPDTKVTAELSDVKMTLTEHQYALLMSLMQSIPRAFSTSNEERQEDSILLERTPIPSRPPSPGQGRKELEAPTQTVDLLPELPVVAHTSDGDIKLFSSTEVAFKVNTISLDLFSAKAVDAASLRSSGLLRFALNETQALVKMLNDGSMEAELGIRSFRLVDTNYSRTTKWRDIVPASKHSKHAHTSSQTGISAFEGKPHQTNQLMLSYSISAGAERAAIANLTLDTPTLIFSLEPLFALANFVTSPFANVEEPETDDTREIVTVNVEDALEDSDDDQPPGSLAYRVNIVDANVILLADPERPDSEAIVLSISQFEMAQQSILVLHTTKIGMALCKMDNPAEKVSFLDELDINLSMDNRSVAGGRNSSIEVEVRPIVMRASFRDVMLVQTIVNRAIELSSSGPSSSAKPVDGALTTTTARQRARTPSAPPKPKVIMERENLKVTFDGFQLVIIGDIAELPLLDLKTQKFMFRATDWSKNLRAGLIIQPFINFFNLSTSHWEPLVDPWEFQLNLSRIEQKWSASIESSKRLELNITSTFINIASTALTQWSTQGEAILQTNRGSNAPFLVRNRTGHSLTLWSDTNRTTDGLVISNGKDAPWRFDDWRTTRENVLATSHNFLALTFPDTPWKQVRHISVDQEGEHLHPLEPRLDKVSHRLCCDVRLTENVKIITFRSTFKVENLTMVPMEMAVIKASPNEQHEDSSSLAKVFKIAPGQEGFVPIESVHEDRIRLRPDAGFKYAWSHHAYHWQELIKHPSRTIICHSAKEDQQFYVQAYAEHDREDSLLKRYPRLTLKLRPPIELENCLPFNLKFRLYDKHKERNYASYVRKGGTSPLHTANLTHLTLLNIELEHRWFKQSDFAIIVTDNPDDLPLENTLLLEDNDGLQIQLKFNYIRHRHAAGAFKLQVYSPFVIVNKTEEALALKYRTTYGQPQNAAGMNVFGRRPNAEQPPSADRSDDDLAFLFAYPKQDTQNRALLRIRDSSWSEPLSFEAVGTAIEVALPSNRTGLTKNGEARPLNYCLGMRISEGTGSYMLTKVVTLYPRYLITNLLNEPLRLRQRGATHTTDLTANKRVPLLELFKDRLPDIHLAFSGSDRWSAPFRMSDVGTVFLRVPDGADKAERLLKIDILLEGACIHLHVAEQTGPWQFTLQNNSSSDLTFWQTPAIGLQNEQQRSVRIYTLNAGQTLPYVWDQPCDFQKTITLVTNPRSETTEQQSQELNILEIGPVRPFRVSTSGSTPKLVAADICAETDTQVVQFTDYEEESNLYKLQRRPTASRQQSLSSLKDLDFEAVEVEAPTNFEFQLKLEGGLGVSVVNKSKVELLYASFRGINFKFVDTTISQTATFECKWIQVDNQLFGGIFEILLYPSEIPKDGKELAAHPTIEASVVLNKDETHGVRYIKYASILLQQMTVEVDEDFMYAVMDFSQTLSDRITHHESTLFDEPLQEIPEPQPSVAANDMYFEMLHLQPVQLDISFMRTDNVNTEGSQVFFDSRNPVAWFLNALTMAIGNVNDAPVRLNMLLLENARLSLDVLVSRATRHYVDSFMSQLYRIVGSADIFGNPIGLFANVSSGISDIFYAPYQGLVMQNEQLGHSLAKGASSFVRKTVFGFSDSLAKISGSVGKGLSAATLDRDFQNQRRMRRARNKPKHALYGITGGAGAFFNSLTSGVEGVARRPIEGLEKDGAAGFFKGFGKGLVGAVTKPAVGFFDLANSVAEGIRNTTTVLDASTITRVRLPRFVASDGILRPYQEREAIGQMWLKSLENGKYMKEAYVAHLNLEPTEKQDEQDLVIILTEQRILVIRTTKLKVYWDVALADLQSIRNTDTGISLVLRGGVPGPFLALPNKSSKLWLFSHFDRVVSQYNKKH